MSVLITYGTKEYASILSDSRESMYNYDTFLYHKENSQKIFKISDKFVIGIVGHSQICNFIKSVKPDNPINIFHYLKNSTYEQLLDFFIERFSSYKHDKKKYSIISIIGIDSYSRIRMDLMDTDTLAPITEYPKEKQTISKIYYPSDISDSFEIEFTNNLEESIDKDSYCESVIRLIASKTDKVNDKIQKYTVRL